MIQQQKKCNKNFLSTLIVEKPLTLPELVHIEEEDIKLIAKNLEIIYE